MPPLRDARYLQAVILVGYAVTAREIFHFERTHWDLLACTLLAVGLDLLLGKFWYRNIQFPLSALIIGLSSSLLIDSRSLWGYLGVVALGILSKALIVYRGKHYFNPTCLGVSVMLLFFPNVISGMPDLFAGHVWPSVIFAILGIATVLWARIALVSFSWIAGFLVLGAIRSFLIGPPLALALAPAASPAFLLFSFHMISDPATTPKTSRLQVAFGLAVAFIDALFRAKQIPYGTFYALFMVSAVAPWLVEIEARYPPLRPFKRAAI